MKKKTISIFVLLSAVILVNSFLMIKFQSDNPIKIVHGLIQVTMTDKDYAEIQEYPKIILAKPEISLEKYMNEQGYKIHDQMGSLYTYMYETGDSYQHIHSSQNKYFSKWTWKE